MLAIRLQRIGKAKYATYRIIVNEKTKDTWGTYLEQVGVYNPHGKDGFAPNADRIKYWMSKGAQPSETLKNLLITAGLLTGKKARSVFISKKRAVKIAEKKKTV